MSIISLSRRDRQTAAEPAADRSRYLTDGTHLYRRAIETQAANGFTWLEDCYSLELQLVSADVIDALEAVPTRTAMTDRSRAVAAIAVSTQPLAPRTCSQAPSSATALRGPSSQP